MNNNREIPTVVISNIAETFIDFLGRSSDPTEREDLINSEAYLCDRTLLWAGDPKLVIGNYPVAHQKFITTQLNFPETNYIAPQKPTPYLCRDILQEDTLLNSIIDYAGPRQKVQLIPYATTPEFLELVDVLRNKHNLEVLTPESPDKDHLWIRDHIDTKAGFRQLVTAWLPDAEKFIPFGVICYNSLQAAKVAYWFLTKGEACLIKANTGENGIGIRIFEPDKGHTVEKIAEQISQDSYFSNDLIVVEKCIPAKQQNSPSLEIRVPRLGEGKPEITYLSKQLFQEFGDFCGIEVSKYLYEQPWYSDLERCGFIIAARLQEMGYVGHFDLDCIVDDNGQLYLLEINSRRTGGTHVHDLAFHTIGPDYINRASLLSYEAMSSKEITDANELLEVVKEYLYPLKENEPYGLVVTVTTTLPYLRFGCLTIAPTSSQALELQKNIANKIEEYCKKKKQQQS